MADDIASCFPQDAERHIELINRMRAQHSASQLHHDAALDRLAWKIADAFARKREKKQVSFPEAEASGYPNAVELNQLMFALPDLVESYRSMNADVSPAVTAPAADIGAACINVPDYYPVRAVILARRQTDLTLSDVPACDSDYGREVARLTNEYRAAKGLHELQWSEVLAAAAQVQADYMVSVDRMQHEGEGGNNVGDRVKAQGYDYRVAAENVASGQETPEKVMQSWKNSPHHNENLLNPDVKEIGVACANPQGAAGRALGKHNIITWTQDFGTPR